MSEMNLKVFLHLHDAGRSNYKNEYFDFKQLPAVGEYITTSSSGDWYKVELVVHTPFSKKMNAEIFAVKTYHVDEMKKYTDA